MANLISTGLLLGTLAAVSSPALEHRVRVDHASGATDVDYRGSVKVVHDQVGTVTPGGRPSSLRCNWKASVLVDREARHVSGSFMTRTVERENVVEGSRPGWCMTHRKAIGQDVARRTDEVRRHVLAVAEEDHPVLTAEIERLHGRSRAG